MLTALIAPVASLVVSTSVGVAIDQTVKMIVPVGIKALPAFGIKVGTAIAGWYVGMRVAQIVEKNVNEAVEIVQSIDAEEVEPTQEDN